MAARKKPKPPADDPQLGPATDDPLPSDQLREIRQPETFRVFHYPSDPHHVAEYVVTVDRDGVRMWESHLWHPSKLDVSSDYDAGDPDAHDGHWVDWHQLEMIAGKGNEIVADVRSEIREIQHEMRTWVSIRAKEAHRIARAREAQRMENVRRLLDRADVVLSSWMKSTPRPMGTWRQMVARGRERSITR